MTAEAGSVLTRPVSTGERRPVVSGGPSSISRQVRTPSFTPTGASSSRNSTPVGQSQLQLLLIGGHIAPGTPVDQGDALHTGEAHGGPGGVHRGVAAADDHHVLPQIQRLGGLFGLFQKAMTFLASPYSRPALPLLHAPVARMTWV